MYFIDFHTHHYPPDNENILALYNIDVAQNKAHVQQIIAQKNVLYSIGLHPWFLENIFFGERDYGILFYIKEQAHLHQNKIIALGEMGLDKHIENTISKNLQYSLFQKQIELAQSIKLPLILHTVNRFNESLYLLKTAKFKQAVAFHGFNKKVNIAQMIWQQQYYTSFGAAIFQSNTAQASLIQCPKDLLFLETDAQNEYDIIKIYEKAAFLRKVSVSQLQAQILENYNRFCTTI